MRPSLAVFLSCCVAGTSAAAEQTFPYRAYVTSNDVYVRSGPGESYYPTDKLKVGEEIEVYRHDPGGWYAIRPPDGSFTWVSGRFLKAAGDDLAEVADDRVAARVGSRLSDIRDVIQVRLSRGEVVQVLDKKDFNAGPDDRTWYKIAPPAGEFRWVSGKYVDPNFPRDGVRKTQVAEGPTNQPDAGGGAAPQSTAPTSAPAGNAGPAAPPSQPSAEPPPVTVRPAAPSGFEPIGGQEPTRNPATPRQLSPAQFQAELEELDLELSTMVVEEPTVWNFDEMRFRATGLLNQAETALERGRARVLSNKIARFEEIRQRHDTLNKLRAQNERLDRQVAAISRGDGGAAPAGDANGRYDGVGKLAEVPSRKVGAPRYALLDPSGKIQCYITPAPGINLRHYLGRQVGVTGTRGYMPERRAQHVVAQHVDTLDRAQLR